MACSLTLQSLPNLNKSGNSLRRAPSKISATVLLLQLCRNSEEVKQLHAQLVVSGLLAHPLNGGWLLESYVKISDMNYALSVFDRIPSPDVFSCNVVLRGLTLCKSPYATLLLYRAALLGGLVPDNHTYTFILKACSYLRALSEGEQVHCQIIKVGITQDTHVSSSLIHMYTNSYRTDCAERVLAEFSEENTLALNSMMCGYLDQGDIEKARMVFHDMSARDVASWSGMISGYRKNGMYEEALELFQEMMMSQVPLNESVLVSSLSACARLGALNQGRWIHAYIDKNGGRISHTVATALIDLYCKCGCVECGYEIFQNMPEKDIVTWGAIISGFALHGKVQKCFELFDQMVAGGIQPNEIVFVSILSACSHAGYVEMGYQYFKKMVHDFGIQPSVEHYGCMVDLLGRAGKLAEAEELIKSMPGKPNSVMWGTLLNACRNQGDVRRGSRAFRQLMELESKCGDRYKVTGLMLSKAGEKEHAYKIRQLIKENNLRTTRGSSFIEVQGIVQEFVAGDMSHSEAAEIYNIWEGWK